LSQIAATLERQLGVPLLVRSSTGVKATEIGTTLLNEARAVLARYEQAVSAVTRSADSDAALLRLGIPA
jgi:DNA-binding transcriptional LysR family regulator